MARLPTELFQHWIHSHEEDTEAVRVYRPKGYPFPPARGRRGLELREDGELVRYGIGRADKPEATPGRWTVAADGSMRVAFPGSELSDEQLEIVSVEPEKLTVRRS